MSQCPDRLAVLVRLFGYLKLRQFALLLSGVSSFGVPAIVRPKCLPNGGTPAHSGHVVFLKVEAEWDLLRQDPHFANLVERIGL
jgi:hypothetical protein